MNVWVQRREQKSSTNHQNPLHPNNDEEEDPFKDFTNDEVAEVQEVCDNQATIVPAMVLDDDDESDIDVDGDELSDDGEYAQPDSPGH